MKSELNFVVNNYILHVEISIYKFASIVEKVVCLITGTERGKVSFMKTYRQIIDLLIPSNGCLAVLVTEGAFDNYIMQISALLV